MKNTPQKLNTKNKNRFCNPIKTLWVIFVMLFFALSANAQTLTAAQIKTDVANVFENKYKKMTSGDIEVKILATQFSELQLPDGKVSYKIIGGGDKIIPRDIKRVDIMVNGVFVKTLNLPAKTSVYKNVLVASDYIDREQSVTKECTTVKKVDVAMNSDYVLSEQMLSREMTTKKPFHKGEILDKRFVKVRPDVARNADVRIFFVSKGAVMITIDGTAITEGMLGEYIKVENKNYRKIYNGKVIGENKVLVKI